MERPPRSHARSVSVAIPGRVSATVDSTGSADMDVHRPPLPPLYSSFPDSAGMISETPSDVDENGELNSNGPMPTFEKQISIDPHSVSYGRASGFMSSMQERNGSTREMSGLPSAPARGPMSDGLLAPHLPRATDFSAKLQTPLQGHPSMFGLVQASPSVDPPSSEYSSNRSSSYSLAESPVSTLDLHRSPVNAATPSPQPDNYFESFYLAAPDLPLEGYRNSSTNAVRTARNLFSGPLPQPERIANYRKAVSLQVREEDDFVNGRDMRYVVSTADITERQANFYQFVNASENHSSLQREANIAMSRTGSLALPHHNFEEMMESPKSSTAYMGCCSFLPFLGGPKSRIAKKRSQVKHPVSEVPFRKVFSQRSRYDIETPPIRGFDKQTVGSELYSYNAEAEDSFRCPSVMEHFENRNSSSIGEIYAEGDEDKSDEEANGDGELSQIERAEEVLLSLNEAYSPVSSAFVFGGNESRSGFTNRGEGSIAARKALKGSNGADDVRPAFRRVRFNLGLTEATDAEIESVVSSSASNSREMTAAMVSRGPSFLSRSRTKKTWDELLAAAQGSVDEYGQSGIIGNCKINDGTNGKFGAYHNTSTYMRAQSMGQRQANLCKAILNGSGSFKEPSKRFYKPMLFRPDTS